MSSLNHTDKQEVTDRSQELSEQIRELTEVCQTILKEQQHVKKQMFMLSVGGIVRLLIVLIPVVLGIIYLPPIAKEVITQGSTIERFQELFNK